MESGKGPTSSTRTCATCLHHSSRDACCSLTGKTARRGDRACGQWSDGKAARKQGGGDEVGLLQRMG